MGDNGLSPCQRRVLTEVANGYSLKEVSCRLVMPVGTVQTHLLRVKEKLHARSTINAVALAVQQGWIEVVDGKY